MSMTIARERALKGAAFLDRVRPGWDQTVDLANLMLCSPRHCVLGQVFRGDALETPMVEDGFEYALTQYRDLGNDGVQHGFDKEELTELKGENYIFTTIVSYQELDNAWAELIEARREQREAYETYAENIAYSGGYEDGYFDGQHSMLAPAKIETVSDITARIPIAG